jgi:hypothetical protein
MPRAKGTANYKVDVLIQVVGDPQVPEDSRKNPQQDLLLYHGGESGGDEGLTMDDEEEEAYEDLKAMVIYCDLKNGKALKSNYSWPLLPSPV